MREDVKPFSLGNGFGATPKTATGTSRSFPSARHVASDQSADVSAHSKTAFRMPWGQRGAPARRTKLERATWLASCRPRCWRTATNAAVALAASGALPENVNYAVKSSLLLSFLESVPDVANKLKVPNTADEKFEDVVKSAQAAAVLVLVY